MGRCLFPVSRSRGLSSGELLRYLGRNPYWPTGQ